MRISSCSNSQHKTHGKATEWALSNGIFILPFEMFGIRSGGFEFGRGGELPIELCAWKWKWLRKGPGTT